MSRWVARSAERDVKTRVLELARWAVTEHRKRVVEFLRYSLVLEEQARVTREFKRGVTPAARSVCGFARACFAFVYVHASSPGMYYSH